MCQRHELEVLPYFGDRWMELPSQDKAMISCVAIAIFLRISRSDSSSFLLEEYLV